MRINTIELKNFRNHKEASFEFEKGINLILGENGSGKTSILDAVGFALFNMSLRSNASETLSMNETSGFVKVIFTGNDENTYVVTRKFPAGAVSLSEEGSKKNITGVNEVYKTINSLIGNTSENPALFENVIVASQNKFTTIFDAKPAEREAVFNSVFGTEIYRQMYRGILKDACDKYDKKLIFAGGEFESKQSQLKDPLELGKVMAAARKEFTASEKIYIKSEKKIDETEKSLKDFESLKNRKEKLLITIKGLSAQIEDKAKSIDAINIEVKTAEAAALEESGLKPKHDEYEKLRALQSDITKEIDLLEISEKEFNANKDQIAIIENSKTGALGSRNALVQQIESDNLTAESLRLEIDKLASSIGLLEKDKVNYYKELTSLTKRKNAFNDLYKKHKEAADQATNKSILALKAEESAGDENKFTSDIAMCDQEYAGLEILKTKRDTLRTGMTRCATLISELEDAKRELSKQSCPYLKEKCKNIEHAGSLTGYFEPRKKIITDQITGFKNELDTYDNLDARLKKCSDIKSAKSEQLVALVKNRQDAMKYRKEESEYRQKAAEFALSIAKLFAGIPGKDSDAVLNDDYSKASAEMQGGESALAARLGSIADALKEKVPDLKKKEKELSGSVQRVETAKKEIFQIDKRIADYESDLKKRFESGEVLKDKIKPLAGLKKKSGEYNVLLKELEASDQLYRRAEQTAARKDELKKRLESEEIELKNLADKKKKEEAGNNAIIYNASDHEKLAAAYGGLKIELKEQNAGLINLKSALDIAVKAVENNARLADELEEKSLEINAVKRKKEIAGKFREDIKLLGPYISGRRTKMIAAAATENFQRMTGRAERILWENTDEQYLVSIASSAGKRRYNMLSGGEQVAVALSIRSALASEMTDCRFAIFDEPTINLDAEKREALSVSLYAMLKNLEQALVVTHDASFREMATKVIELG